MLTLTALLAALPALAQDPEYTGTAEAEEAVEKPETDLSAELGFTNSIGNAFFVSVNGGINFSHRWSQNRFAAAVGTNLNLVRLDTDGDGTVADEGRTPLEWTSQRAFGQVRYDRFFGLRDALYVAGGGEHDRPAGLLWRFNQQIGYSRVLVNNDRTTFEFELGLSYNEENFLATTLEDGTVRYAGTLDAHYLAARGFLNLAHAFNDVVTITESLELIEPLVAWRDGEDGLTNFADFRLVNQLSITTRLTDLFSLKVSDRLAFDNQPPSEEYAKVDNTVMVTLVATIL